MDEESNRTKKQQQQKQQKKTSRSESFDREEAEYMYIHIWKKKY